MEAEAFSHLSALYLLAQKGDRGKVREALEANPALVEAANTDEWYPNFIAACLAMVGDREGAIDWLERAVAWGYSNTRFLRELSPFLAPLRGLPRFEALLERAQRQAAALDA